MWGEGPVIGQQVARGGEMLWFHSVTVGGSVKKLISYSLESCELFFKKQIEIIFQILHKAFMKEN